MTLAQAKKEHKQKRERLFELERLKFDKNDNFGNDLVKKLRQEVMDLDQLVTKLTRKKK